MRSLVLILVLACGFQHLWAQDCIDFKHRADSARSAEADPNYPFILAQLEAYRRCDASKDAYVASEILNINKKILQQRDSARAARKRADSATKEAVKEKETALYSLWQQYIISAQNDINSGNYERACADLDSSNKIKESQDAALLFSQILNSHPPFNFPKDLDNIDKFFLNSANDKVGLLNKFYKSNALSEVNNTLFVFDLHTHKFHKRSGYFIGANFSLDGTSIYAVNQKKTRLSGTLGYVNYDLKTTLYKFDLSLVAIDSVDIPTIKTKDKYGIRENDSSSYDPTAYQDIRIDNQETKLILSGYASESWERNISNGMPHNLTTVIELQTKKVSHLVSDDELSAFYSFHSKAQIFENNRVIDSRFNQLLSWDIETGAIENISLHSSNISGIACSPDSRKVAVVGDDNKLSLFTYENGKSWAKQSYLLPGSSGCESISFIGNYELAIARTDFNITLFPLSDSLSDKPSSLIGHSAKINSLIVSPDQKWLASASEDRTIRVWSLLEGARFNFIGSGRSLKQIAFTFDSKNLVSCTTTGIVKSYSLYNNKAFSVSGDFQHPKHEEYISDVDLDEGGGLDRNAAREKADIVKDILWDKNLAILYSRNYRGVTQSWDWKQGQLLPTNSEERSNTIFEAPNDTTASIDSIHNRWVEIDGQNIVIHSGLKNLNKSKLALGWFSPDNKYFVQFNYNNERIYIWAVATHTAKEYYIPGVEFYQTEFGEPLALHFSKYSAASNILVYPCTSEGKIGLGLIYLKKQTISFFDADLTMGSSYDINSVNGKIIAGCRMGQLLEYSPETNQTKFLGQHGRYVNAVRYSSDGSWAASCSRDRTVRLIAPSGLNFSYPLLNPPENILFSPDNEQLFIASGSGIYALNILSTIHFKPATILNFEKNNNYFYSSNSLETNYTSYILSSDVDNHDRKHYVETYLQKKIFLSVENKTKLVKQIVSSEGKRIECRNALMELSVYKGAALSTLSELLPVLRTDRSFENELMGDFANELFSYTGPETVSAIIKELKATKDKWVIAGILRLLMLIRPGPTIKTDILPLLSNKDKDVRITSALLLASISESNAAIPILGDALAQDHELYEEAGQLISKYKLAAVPFLITTLRYYSPTMGDGPSELAEKAIQHMGPGSVPFLTDTLKANLGNTDFAKKLISLIGYFHLKESFPLLLELLNKYKGNPNNSQIGEALISAICTYGDDAIRILPVMMEVLQNSSNGFSIAYDIRKLGSPIIPYVLTVLPRMGERTRDDLYMTLQPFAKNAKAGLPAMVEDLSRRDKYHSSELLELLATMGPVARPAIPVLLQRISRDPDYSDINCLDSIASLDDADTILPVIISALEFSSKMASIPEYMVTDKSVESLYQAGVPDSIILKIKSLNDMLREKSVFFSIIEREIGIGESPKYQSILEEACLFKKPHYCEEHSLEISTCCSILKKLKIAAKPYISSLRRIKQDEYQCLNVQKEIEQLIQEIEDVP